MRRREIALAVLVTLVSQVAVQWLVSCSTQQPVRSPRRVHPPDRRPSDPWRLPVQIPRPQLRVAHQLPGVAVPGDQHHFRDGVLP